LIQLYTLKPPINPTNPDSQTITFGDARKSLSFIVIAPHT